MKHFLHQERDYAFGQMMLTLRSSAGLTQAELAQALGVSRRTVVDWESGEKYPKTAHLKQFVELALAQQAFPAEHTAEAIRALWKASHQKELLSEEWLAELLAAPSIVPHTPAELANQAVQPPAASAERQPISNLPFQPTTFIGRNAELAAIARLLGNPACRLLTLHGPGGIGKTRLAIAAASSTASAFPDGVMFVSLAALSMPSQIVSAIGEALQLSFGQADPTAHLFSALRERQLLLILDNFEHLLAGADLVSAILAHALHVKIVVTSRERLNLQAEWLFNVDGLTFPQPPSIAQAAAKLTEYSAIELFVERARQIQPSSHIDENLLSTIVQICQHVAGMPLAIELAAASTRILPVAEIEQQIRANLDVLATNLRDVPLRHRNMRAVFNHSWDLLNAEERTLFSQLAIFSSGWTAEAATQVAGATRDLVTALVDKSLVRANTLAAAGDSIHLPEPRFMMLEPLRSYALEQLAARGEEAAVRHSHTSYYLALAEAAAAEWNTPLKEATNTQLSRELNNIHAALEWAYETGNSQLGLRFAVALWRFWRRFGYISEGRIWFARLLQLDAQPNNADTLALRERALHAAAWLASDQHDYVQATRLFEQNLALRRAQAGSAHRVDPLRNAAAARQARAEGNYAQAAALMDELLAQHHAAADAPAAGSTSARLSPDELGQALREFGTILREQGNFARATALFEQDLALYRSQGDRVSQSFALIALGDVARDQGDTASVRAYCEPNLAILHEFGIQWAIGFALNNLALAAYYERNLTQALSLIRESVALFRTTAASSSLAEVLISLGKILLAQGEATAAYHALTEALRLAVVVGPRLMVLITAEELASVLITHSEAQLSTQLLAATAALRTQMGTPVRPADRAALANTIASARTALGEAAFAATWATAQTQPLEQILTMLPNTIRAS